MQKHYKYWLAAAIDGEGSIYIHKPKPKSRRQRVTIAITNNNEEWLKAGQSMCKMGIIFPCNGAFQLRIERDADVLHILKELNPLLIVKRAKAKQAIDILSKKKKWRQPHGPDGKFICLGS